jgi:hypothetical protein
MARETILTAELSEESRKQLETEEKDWVRFKLIIQICFEHYISAGAKMELEKFVRLIVGISRDFEGDELEVVPERGRYRIIGEYITKAVRVDLGRVPGDIPISSKSIFKPYVKDLVEMAYLDGYKKNKKSQTRKPSAYEVVAGLLYKYGITNNGQRYSASTICNWCSENSSK